MWRATDLLLGGQEGGEVVRDGDAVALDTRLGEGVDEEGEEEDWRTGGESGQGVRKMKSERRVFDTYARTEEVRKNPS